MPKTPKNPSLKKVAKTYRKTHKVEKSSDGAHYWNKGGNTESRGTSFTNLNYKPKPRTVTFGTSRKGKGATVKRLGRG